MENARVALFEDDDVLRGLIVRRLARFGHTVVHAVADMDGACELIDALEDDEVDVAVVDGDLGGGFGEGAEVVTRLKVKYPGIVAVGNSSGGDIEGAEHNARKETQLLVDIIDAI